MTVQLPPIPDRIARLPRDPRGYPIPAFVAVLPDGTRDFRVASPSGIARCVKQNCCWVCGEEFTDSILAFVVGPMCTVNQISAEPPSHPECAEFSVLACPFLKNPSAVRRDANMPCASGNMPGNALLHNPHVSAVWTTNRYKLVPVSGGVLFQMGPAQRVDWYKEGRLATRAEVLAGFERGLQVLAEIAAREGREAQAELVRQYEAALARLPQE